MPDQPKYVEIADDLAARIRRGEWGPGEQLPGQAVLAEEQQVGVQTITKAFEILQNEGLVRTERRAGSFVTEQTHIHNTASADWHRRSHEERFEDPRATWETLDAGTTEADDVPSEVRQALALEADEGAMWRTRRLLDAGEPAQWHQAWWQGRLRESCPELADPSPVSPDTASLIEARSGRQIAGGRDQSRARGASSRDVELLGVERGAPVLELQRRKWDQDGDPLLFEVDVYPGLLWCRHDEYHGRGQLGESSPT